ncbi:MAG: lysophospholipid acyltransferase family protein [Sphaerochaetaceae bacterium]|jgi:1-acyl-sn-glycerol-3-phosphate acyltransferase|nr:1-acyl-sn-glycerol-3-phosphate acyltransferase [Sphaerochaeta sp.]
MKLSERITNAVLRTLFRLFFTMNLEEFEKVPRTGPFMLIANHTAAFDGPLMYVFMRPREMVAMAKQELWDHMGTRYLMNLWNSIPVDRENMGRQTMEQCFSILDRGDILAIAPEGTRSSDGALQQGKAGVAFIAHKKQVPMVPVAITGFENLRKNIKRLRRTPITIAVGKPFEVANKGGRLDADGRQKLVDEIMLRLAELMPPSHWGFYEGHQLDFTMTKTV